MMSLWLQSIKTKSVGLGLLISIAMTVASCGHQEKTPQLDDELSRVSAVTVTSPGFSLEAGARLAWRSDVLWMKSDEFSNRGNPVSQLPVRAIIERQLQQMGFYFVGDSHSADYVIVAAVVLGDSKQAKAFEALARMYPSLEHISETLEKGTLMMALSRPGSPLILWRSGLQAFIAEDISAEQRQQRLYSVVRMLLSTLPLEAM